MPTESHEAADAGRFHTLAWCSVRYANPTPDAAELRLNYSPSAGFTRFSFQVLTANGDVLLYQRGPEHSAIADAALLAAWTDFGVPAFVWQLSPIPSGGEFDSERDAASYAGARLELCRALYPLRMRVWAGKKLNIDPLVHPPEGGFPVVDAFAANAENAEVLRAAEDDGSDDAIPQGST